MQVAAALTALSNKRLQVLFQQGNFSQYINNVFLQVQWCVVTSVLHSNVIR